MDILAIVVILLGAAAFHRLIYDLLRSIFDVARAVFAVETLGAISINVLGVHQALKNTVCETGVS